MEKPEPKADDWAPRPDPTERTVDALQRELQHIKEIWDARNASYDKAISLLQSQADKSPTIAVVDSNVRRLEDVVNEKLAKVDTQIAERDTATEQKSRDAKVTLDAALQAAKEAVSEQNKANALAMAKTEAAFTKQIDQQQLLMQQTAEATSDKIDDLKTRLTTIEGRAAGIGASWGVVVAVVASVIAAGSLIALVVAIGK